MAIDLLLLANVLAPLHTATDGMERSTYELINTLAECRELRLTVIAHPATELPAGVSLVRAAVPSCPPEYIQYGDGQQKWEHIANDAGLLTALSELRHRSVVHDLSSSVSACALASARRNPVIKTLRLQPAHPSCSLTAKHRSWSIHISDFQQKMDRWSDHARSSVFYDLIPAPAIVKRETPSGCFVSVGRVEQRKGHETAVHVARCLGKPLMIIGRIVDVDFARRLERMSGVTLAGEIPHMDIFHQIRNSCGLVWTPAIPEPGGRVVVEALRTGVEVFALPVGLAADIIEASGESSQTAIIPGLSIYRLRELPRIWNFTPAEVGAKHVSLYRDMELTSKK